MLRGHLEPSLEIESRNFCLEGKGDIHSANWAYIPLQVFGRAAQICTEDLQFRKLLFYLLNYNATENYTRLDERLLDLRNIDKLNIREL